MKKSIINQNSSAKDVERWLKESGSDKIDIFERPAMPNERIIGILGKGKPYVFDNQSKGNEIRLNSSAEILPSTSKDA